MIVLQAPHCRCLLVVAASADSVSPRPTRWKPGSSIVNSDSNTCLLATSLNSKSCFSMLAKGQLNLKPIHPAPRRGTFPQLDVKPSMKLKTLLEEVVSIMAVFPPRSALAVNLPRATGPYV